MNKKMIKKRKKELFETVSSIRSKGAEGLGIIEEETLCGQIDLVLCPECFCPFSKEETLSEEVFEYLRRKTNLFPSVLPVRLHLYGCKDEQQFVRLSRNVKSHYQAEMVDVLWDKRVNQRHFAAMLLLGLSVISFSIGFSYAVGENLMFEALSLFGSFALWEAADAFLVQRREIKKRLLETASMLSMEIVVEEGSYEQDK